MNSESLALLVVAVVILLWYFNYYEQRPQVPAGAAPTGLSALPPPIVETPSRADELLEQTKPMTGYMTNYTAQTSHYRSDEENAQLGKHGDQAGRSGLLLPYYMRWPGVAAPANVNVFQRNFSTRATTA